MNLSTSRFTPYLEKAALAVLGVLALVAVIYGFTKTVDASGAIDFHSYWVSGLFVRQGVDPYRAYLEKRTPDLPIRFLDGEIESGPVAQPGLATVPANSYPMVILLSGFSFFTWPTAKLLWLTVNWVCMLLVPWMVFRLLGAQVLFRRSQKILLYLLFVALFGTRNVVGNGQTSLLVFVLMLAALLLAKRSRLAAGICLGLALSKFSLALPVVLVLLYRRQIATLVIGAAVQIAAWLGLALYTAAPALELLTEYLQIVAAHLAQPGIHLASLFPNNPAIGLAAVLLMSTVTFGGLGYHFFTNRELPETQLFSILLLWTLLVAYHRAYDTFGVIIFFALLMKYATEIAQTAHISPSLLSEDRERPENYVVEGA